MLECYKMPAHYKSCLNAASAHDVKQYAYTRGGRVCEMQAKARRQPEHYQRCENVTYAFASK